MKIADDLLEGNALAFGRHSIKVSNPPDWHKNIFTSKSALDADKHWSRVPDFSREFGEIKTIWELSRCEWSVVFAKAWRITGDAQYLDALNHWLDDWQQQNPANQGPNWKCGQETSIRLLHVLFASAIIEGRGSVKSTERLRGFIAAHAKRIEATLSYALAQDNNHGTSEAAALFICGHWLAQVETQMGSLHQKQAARWARKGRSNLEERMARLVLDDGTFSQYSSTYQRVLLATITQVLMWRELLDLPHFSSRFMAKTGLSMNWLVQLIDPVSGDAPNLGANDGANIFRVTWREDYRDFAPCVAALAYRLQIAGPHFNLSDSLRDWLPELAGEAGRTAGELARFSAHSMPQGGFEKLLSVDKKSWILLRTANFRFRPPHADINHVDLWFEGTNILVDSGSYSYGGPPPGAKHDFKTAFAHNTITFDDHDQMPSLGRFLYGEWPDGSVLRAADGSWVESTVRFPDGNQHRRRLQIGKQGEWIISDELSGSFEAATLRWHLADLDWKLDKTGNCLSDSVKINITSSDERGEQALLKPGVVSRYYLDTEPCKVLEVPLKSTSNKTLVTTIISFLD